MAKSGFFATAKFINRPINAAELAAIQSLANAKGIEMASRFNFKPGFDRVGTSAKSPNAKIVGFKADYNTQSVTFEQFVQGILSYTKQKDAVTIRGISSEYNAVVNPNGTVSVGCQSIPFAKVKEIHAAILAMESAD